MIKIVNVETGEIIERELTKAEKDQRKIDFDNWKIEQANIETKNAQRQAILDRLGLTADEAKLLLG